MIGLTGGRSGTVISGKTIMAVVVFLVSILILSFGMGRIPGLEDELRDKSVDITAERIETAIYAFDAVQDDVTFEQGNMKHYSMMELELPDEYHLVNVEDDGDGQSGMFLRFEKNSSKVDPVTENSTVRFHPDYDASPENVEGSDKICLMKDSATESVGKIYIKGGECDGIQY